jgi:hypothetical protein
MPMVGHQAIRQQPDGDDFERGVQDALEGG